MQRTSNQSNTRFFLRIGVVCCVLAFVSSIMYEMSFADTADQLRNKIQNTNTQIQQLEAEIKQYQASLDKTAEQSQSLQNELTSLTLAKKKLETELALTTKNLDKTASTLGKLKTQISTTEQKIDVKRTVLQKTLADVRDFDYDSLLEVLGSGQTLAQMSD